jgi:hypothetical protein
MNSNKVGRVKAGLEARNGLLFEMLFPLRCESHVVVLRFGIVKLSNRN